MLAAQSEAGLETALLQIELMETKLEALCQSIAEKTEGVSSNGDTIRTSTSLIIGPLAGDPLDTKEVAPDDGFLQSFEPGAMAHSLPRSNAADKGAAATSAKYRCWT